MNEPSKEEYREFLDKKTKERNRRMFGTESPLGNEPCKICGQPEWKHIRGNCPILSKFIPSNTGGNQC